MVSMLTSGYGVPKMNERVQGEEGRTGLRCGSRAAVEREPHQHGTGNDIRSADIAHEMGIERPALRSVG